MMLLRALLDSMGRMASAGLVSTLIATCIADVAAAAVASAEPRILIRDVMLASPERDAAYGPVSVRIVGTRIEAIGARLPASASDTVIDGAGRYLAPGLIDSHVHLADLPGFRPEDLQAHPDAAAAATTQTPRSYLFHGFTTVVDLAANSTGIADWNAQAVRPQAYFCGAAPVQDGYPMNFVPRPARYEFAPDYLYDPASGAALPEDADAAQHTPESVVTRIDASGAICVKTYYEKGFGAMREQLPVPGAKLSAK